METIDDLFPEEPQVVYVVMWEKFDSSSGCTGGDLYMSLNKGRAVQFMNEWAHADETLWWDDKNDMWRYSGRYEWEKLYVVENALDEEL